MIGTTKRPGIFGSIRKGARRLSVKSISLIITSLLFTVLLLGGGLAYERFLTFTTVFNLFNDNAYLIIVSVGITFVLLTGGIDISVGSTVAFTCVFSAYLLRAGWPAHAVIPLLLTIGITAGAGMGYLIHVFKLQPFIVTLAGQFFFRGLCSVISTESIPIADGFYKALNIGKIIVAPRQNIYFYVSIALVVLAAAHYVLGYTRFGRTVYAIGGNEQSAGLMGLPVKRTKILAYAVSSACAVLGGVVFSFYTLAGYSLQNPGLELEAISSAVIGGTLLSGGSGTVIGSTIGVLIQGVIQKIVTFQNLNSWWGKVTIAALLCLFIVLQRVIVIRSDKLKRRRR